MVFGGSEPCPFLSLLSEASFASAWKAARLRMLGDEMLIAMVRPGFINPVVEAALAHDSRRGLRSYPYDGPIFLV